MPSAFGKPVTTANRFGVVASGSSYALISGGTAGTITTSWTTRTIDTEVYDASAIVSIAANAFTLIAGTYLITAVTGCRGPLSGGAFFQAVAIRLRNTTDSTTVSEGCTFGGSDLSSVSRWSPAGSVSLSTVTTIASAKTFEIQNIVPSVDVQGGAAEQTPRHVIVTITKIA